MTRGRIEMEGGGGEWELRVGGFGTLSTPACVHWFIPGKWRLGGGYTVLISAAEAPDWSVRRRRSLGRPILI